MVSHLDSFRYVDVGGEIHETPFQAFEVVRVVMAPPVEEAKNVEFPMASLKDALTIIRVDTL